MDHRHLLRPSTPTPSIADGLTSIPSPKRKRDSGSDTDYDSPRANTVRFRTELPSRPRVEVAASPTSPRSKVSRQLHNMKLNNPDLAFSSSVMAFGKNDQGSFDSSGSWNVESSPTESNEDTTIVLESPTRSDATSIPIPSSPVLVPSKTTEIAPVSPYPSPTPIPQEDSPNKSARNRSPPPSNSSAGGSRTSPPPQNMDLVWSAAEITGHDPSDPSDDGYGINGIGFRPTPAMAYVRSQRRKQQVAEWKTREAKEARQKRMDRRRKVSAESDENGAAGRRVRFLEN